MYPLNKNVKIICSLLHDRCCVCLGDFEIKEELLQVPSCKHVFHIDCIHHWLHTNTSCPLCRCSVIPTVKLANPTPPPPPPPLTVSEPQSSSHAQFVSAAEQQHQIVSSSSRLAREELTSTTTGGPTTMAVEESPSTSHNRVSRIIYSGIGMVDRESAVTHIQAHNLWCMMMVMRQSIKYIRKYINIYIAIYFSQNFQIINMAYAYALSYVVILRPSISGESNFVD